MQERNLILGETRSMLWLYFRYIVTVAVLSGLFLYVAVRYGNTATVFMAGFLPATMAGVQIASRAFRLGRDYEHRQNTAAKE